MSKYTEILLNAGIAETRVESIETAMNALHSALSKLDFRNMRRFMVAGGIHGQLEQYCKANGVRNVAHELDELMFFDAYQHIDLNEFTPKSSKMMGNLIEFSRDGLPGAAQLMRSALRVNRMIEGKVGLSWHNLAEKVTDIAAEYRGEHGRASLDINRTKKYNGKCSHLDDQYTIGEFQILWTQENRRTRMQDNRESGTDIYFVYVKVDDGHADKGIRRALKDSLDDQGCSCMHDCCGCRSQYVRQMKCIGRRDTNESLWAVKVHYHYNIG